ncbi:hypothetical protein Tco_1187888 [Tanacetum coccineum]
MQPVALPSLVYVLGPEHSPSPEYVPSPEHPPSPVEVPYVPEPEYPEYLVLSDAEAPLEDQPLPADASPTALSLGYVADSDPDKDPKEILLMEGMDEDDDEKEEEHLAPADSLVVPVIDPVPSARDTESFKTDESAPIPRSPHTKVPFAQTRLRRARKTVRLKPPMSASIEARIAEHATAPTPPLPVASPPLPLPSPLTTTPIDAGVPLGYRAPGIRMRAASPPLLLPSTYHRTDILEAEMPPRKRACFTTPTHGHEVGESSAAGAARQLRPTLEADLRRDRVMETGRRLRSFRFLDREAMYARTTWTSSEDRSAAIKAHVRTLEAQVATLIAQTSLLQIQLTTVLERIMTLEARDLEPQDEPAKAGSSC